MATTYTPNYNLAQPEVGGEPDTWGGLLNADLGTLDTVIKAISDIASAALSRAGGTVSGPIVFSGNGNGVVLDKPGSGTQQGIFGRSNNAPRWSIIPGNATAEAGANAGSDFQLQRFDDAGNSLGSPLVISRATGQAVFGIRPSFNGQTPWDTLNFDPASKANLSGATFTGAVVFAGPATGFATRPSFGIATPWDSANFDPTAKANLAGATFSGAITAPSVTAPLVTAGVVSVYSGTVGAQTILRNAGWSNGVPRWKEVIETNADYQLYTYDTAGGSPAQRLSIGQASGIVSAVDFASTSDERLKTDIELLTGATERLKQARPRTYRKEGRAEAGWLAQEVRRVLATAVSDRGDGILVVSYGQLAALVAATVLEVEERVTALEGQI